MNFEELKTIVDKRLSPIVERSNKYKAWQEVLGRLEVTGFTVVIVYESATTTNNQGFPQEVDNALLWNSNRKSIPSQFYLATIEKEGESMARCFLIPLNQCPIEKRGHFFQTINDEEVEKIIKNCLKIDPTGFHYINPISSTTLTDGAFLYFEKAIERYHELIRAKSIKGQK